MPKVVHLVMAARPNFMKVAPLWHELRRHEWVTPMLVHTGQHYDPNLSDAILHDLGLPVPDHFLGVGSGTHAQQTAAVMVAYEAVLQVCRPDLVVVVGDVNSTVACALTATKLHIPVAHLEAGLRSRDRTMPEEINRVVTDAISDLLWTPSQDADENLLYEGVAPEAIDRVGNIMIDSLEMLRPRIEAEGTVGRLGLRKQAFGIATLHRPANVDAVDSLTKLVDGLITIAESTCPVVFPVHPRTRLRLESFKLLPRLNRCREVILTEPQPYVAFMNLVFSAAFVLTDSGGLQEETSHIGIPCFTLRPNTERPITVTEGTNRLVSIDDDIAHMIHATMATPVTPRQIDLWDGKAATRVAASIQRFLAPRPALQVAAASDPS